MVDAYKYASWAQYNEQDENAWEIMCGELFSSLCQQINSFKQRPTNKIANSNRIPRYIVNRVKDFTKDNLDYHLSISEICAELRVSRRTLNHAFSRAIGIAPVAYMRNIRLHRVRSELINNPYAVCGINHAAYKYGFTHMSLFSKYYRELFGESPRETLRRCRSGL